MLAALLMVSLVTPALAASPEGLWLTENRRGVIEIAPCGAALCGRIVGMKNPAPDGVPSKDFQGRPECGLEIIHALVPGDAGEWNGTITNPENGNVYGARLSPEDGQLRLRGFLRVPLVGSALGSTQLWTAYTGTVTAECQMEP
jgi:uncharacterized protein (DUF2147 family)